MKDLGKSSAVSKKASVPLIGNNNRYKTVVEVQSHKYINSCDSSRWRRKRRSSIQR